MKDLLSTIGVIALWLALVLLMGPLAAGCVTARDALASPAGQTAVRVGACVFECVAREFTRGPVAVVDVPDGGVR